MTQFSGDDRGTSLIEFALLSAMIVGVILLTWQSLVGGADFVLDRAAGGLKADFSPTMRSVAQRQNPKVDDPKSERNQVPDRRGAAASIIVAVLVIAAAFALTSLNRRRLPRLDQFVLRAPPNNTAAQAAFVAKRQDIFRSMLGDLEGFLTDNVRVRHLMTTHLTTVRPHSGVEDMSKLMLAHEMRHLLVVDADGKLAGVVSDRDLKGISGKSALEIMTTKPLICGSDTPVRTAVTMLLETHISSLPVVDSGKLVGILTMSDVAMALQCMFQLVEKVVADLPRDPHIAAAVARATRVETPEPCLA